jgi:hypothetical protein
MPLVYHPFDFEESHEPEILTALDEDISVPSVLPSALPSTLSSAEETEDGVIREMDGIHYINDNILNVNNSEYEALDPEFRKLVDSVIQQNG